MKHDTTKGTSSFKPGSRPEYREDVPGPGQYSISHKQIEGNTKGAIKIKIREGDVKSKNSDKSEGNIALTPSIDITRQSYNKNKVDRWEKLSAKEWIDKKHQDKI